MYADNPIGLGTVHVDYNGSKGDVQCFQGKGSRSIQWGSGKI